MNVLLEVRGGHERRWKRYPAYRDSRVEWLGEVPEGWETTKTKHTTYVKGRIGWQGLKSDEFIEVGPYLVTGTDFIEGVVNWGTCYHVSKERYDEDPYIQLRENDLLITKDGTIGKTAIVEDLPDDACLNSGIFLTRPLSGGYITPFMYWLLNSVVFTKFIDYTKTGTTINHLYQNVFVEFVFPVPSIPEQRAIAAFLDRETGHIDALAAKKERLADLLEEKRTALISHVVTKGLDPDAPMKDSGIEWLGEVPEEWEIRRNGALFTQRDERGFPDLPLLSVSLHTGTSVREFSSDRIEQMAEDRSTYKRAKKGDIVFNKMRMWQGAVGVAPTDGLVSTDYTVAKPLEGVQPRYFEHLFRTSFYKTETNRYSYGIVPDRNRLYWDRFKQMPSIYPPFNEQLEIVNRLDQLTEQTNRLSGSIREQIDKLKEYRTALISAAVTGKIDVRGEIP